MSRNIKNKSNRYILEGNEGYLKIPIGSSVVPPLHGTGSIRFNDIFDRLEIYTSGYGWSTLASLNDISVSGLYVLKTGDTITGDIIFSSGNLTLPVGTSSEPSIKFADDTGVNLENNGNIKIYVSGNGVLQVSATGGRFGSSNANISFVDSFFVEIDNFGYLKIKNTNVGADSFVSIENNQKSILTFYDTSANDAYNITREPGLNVLYIDYNDNEFKNIVVDISGKVGINVSASHTLNESLEVKGNIKVISENSYILPTSAGLPGQFLISNGPGNPFNWNTIITFSGITLSSYPGGVNVGLGVSANREIILRSLQGGGIIEVSALPNSIVISAAQNNIQLSSLGTGTDIVFASSKEINPRRIQAGGIIELSAKSDGSLVVSAAPASFTQNVTVSSLGGGESLAIGVSANSEIQLRTITGSGIVEATTTVYNTVQISAARATIETSSLGGVSLGLAVSAGTGNRNELRIRGLTGGGIIEVSALANSIVISAAINDNDRLIGYGSSNAIIVSAPLSSIRFITQSAVRMTITDSGLVGIGTTNPNATLEIFDPLSENSIIQIVNSATGVSSLAGIIFGLLSGSTNLSIQNRSFSNINFDIGLENRFSIGYDEFILRGDSFENLGDAEIKKYILTGIVSADTLGVQRYLFLPGSSRMIIPPNSSWLFEITVLGKERNGVEAVGYRYKGVIIRSSVSADSVFFVGLPLEEIIAESTGAYGWEASVTANTTHGSLDVYVLLSGYSGDNVYWVSYANIIQISV